MVAVNSPPSSADKDECALDATESTLGEADTPSPSSRHNEEKFHRRASTYFEQDSPRVKTIWAFVGLIFATLVSSLYYVAVFLACGVIGWVVFSRGSFYSLVALAVLVSLSGACPAPHNSFITNSKLYLSTSYYFDGECVFEEAEDQGLDTKPILFLCFPHGVVSLGGWVLGTLYRGRPSLTAAAQAVQHVPILRNIYGAFGVTDGSRQNLRMQLREKKRDIFLYPGGLAELFLSDPGQETLYFDNRKGCIKLAMESGADIRVVYLFGNTQLFRLTCSAAAARISRAWKCSLTFFWGRFGLPIPHKTKLLVVVGKRLTMPDHSDLSLGGSELTPALVEEKHRMIKREIERLFDKYKSRHPSYCNRRLNVI